MVLMKHFDRLTMFGKRNKSCLETRLSDLKTLCVFN